MNEELNVALEQLRQELENLKPAVKLIDQMVELLEKVNNLPDEIRKQIDDIWADIKINMDSVVSRLRSVITQFQQICVQQQNSQREFLESAEELRSEIHQYFIEIQDLNIPARLDGIDSTLSNMNLSIEEGMNKKFKGLLWIIVPAYILLIVIIWALR